MKVVFITGGTSGIGFAIGEAFEIRGYRVYVCGRREGFERFNYLRADVSKYEEIKGIVEYIVGKEGGIDVLVVNAGIGRVGYVEEFPIEEWEEVINTNLNGAFYTVKAALPYIREGGNIIFIGSVASKEAFAGWSAYCASKFGLLGFARSLADELRGKIKVSFVMPGAVDTDIWNSVGYKPPKEAMLKPEDVARVVLEIVENPGWIREIEILPKGGIL